MAPRLRTRNPSDSRAGTSTPAPQMRQAPVCRATASRRPSEEDAHTGPQVGKRTSWPNADFETLHIVAGGLACCTPRRKIARGSDEVDCERHVFERERRNVTAERGPDAHTTELVF